MTSRLKWNGPRAVETYDGDKMGYMGDSEVTAQVERIRRSRPDIVCGVSKGEKREAYDEIYIKS